MTIIILRVIVKKAERNEICKQMTRKNVFLFPMYMEKDKKKPFLIKETFLGFLKEKCWKMFWKFFEILTSLREKLGFYKNF